MSGRSLGALCVVLASLAGHAQLPEPHVPEALEDWRGWVLHGEEHRRCPFLHSSAASAPEDFVCTWPGQLEVDVDAEGGRFAQTLTVYGSEQWVALPGDADVWPQNVTVDREAVPVLLRDGVPAIRLAPGRYRIGGVFSWDERPARLAVPRHTGLLALVVDGERIALPRRQGDQIWLGAGEQAEQTVDALIVNVYRRVMDAVPTRLDTVLQIDVAGAVREEQFAPALPAGFVPLALHAQLPSRLEANGNLRVQVRPGQWEIALRARADTVLDEIVLVEPEYNLPGTEIWSYQATPRLRATLPEAPRPVDPQQVDAPWLQIPAFRLQPGESLAIVERRRGKAEAANALRLRRELWLDFDRTGFVFVDALGGVMHTDWRLDMAAPYVLRGAAEAQRPVLVTRSAHAGTDAAVAGIEVRQAAVDVQGRGRIETRGAVPVAGWLTDFAAASVTLHLPPGHKLLAALGVDRAPQSWTGRWRLLDFFVLLIVTVAATRLFGRWAGGTALLALTLSYHEPAAPVWTWLNLLAAVALVRVSPPGRLLRSARRYRMVSLGLLALFLIPFVVEQIRIAVYPQLEPESHRRAQTVGWFEMLAGQLWTNGGDAVVEGSADTRFRQSPHAVLDAVDQAKVLPRRVGDVIFDQTFQAGVSADARESRLARYADDALVQIGPGQPDWRWTPYALSFSGPLAAERTMRLLILPDWLVSILRLLAVGLLGAFAALFVFDSLDRPWRWPSWLRLRGKTSGKGVGRATASLLVIGVAAASIAHADTPPADVLETLKQRLLALPSCTPRCAEIVDATVVAGEDEVAIRLHVHAEAAVAVPMPGAAEGWRPVRVADGDGENRAGHRDGDGVLWVRVEPGRHILDLTGPVPSGDAVEIPFPAKPRAIAAQSEHWLVAGLHQGTLSAGSLNLSRIRQSTDGAAGAAPDDAAADWEASRFPVFVRVERTITLDLDWSVATVVHRIAPSTGAINIAIPLLDDEAVGTDHPVVEGALAVSMDPTQQTFEWASTLPRVESMTLRSPAGEPWREVWRVAVGSIWQAAFEGVPENAYEGDRGGRVAEFQPRPGERLNMMVTRPLATPGNTLAFDQVTMRTAVGAQRRSTKLILTYRSSRGTSHPIRLPVDAQLQSVAVDDISEPVALVDGVLDLPILPGRHHVQIVWDEDVPPGLRVQTPAVVLDAPTSNIITRLDMPASRWLLFATGPSLGPAILYWSELIALLAIAAVLGRIKQTPLHTRHWILLGLGFSTFSWLALAVVALWLLAHGSRTRWGTGLSPLTYNATQIGFALLTLAAFAAILTGIPAGLLGNPDMHITGFESFGQHLSWFSDQTDSAIAEASVWSLPLWTYKALILAWALWLSLALVRWLPWVWARFAEQGLWRRAEDEADEPQA